MNYKVSRNDQTGAVDSVNRIVDGATVPRWDSSSPITQQFNAWLAQNPTFDIANRPVDAAVITSLKEAKKLELQSAATNTIRAGFTSNALGAAYTYKGRLYDQSNISAAASISTLKKLTSSLSCTNASGVRAMRAHTQDQSQTVLKDLQTARETVMTKYRTLAAQVDSATTPAQISAIVWS